MIVVHEHFDYEHNQFKMGLILTRVLNLSAPPCQRVLQSESGTDNGVAVYWVRPIKVLRAVKLVSADVKRKIRVIKEYWRDANENKQESSYEQQPDGLPHQRNHRGYHVLRTLFSLVIVVHTVWYIVAFLAQKVENTWPGSRLDECIQL